MGQFILNPKGKKQPQESDGKTAGDDSGRQAEIPAPGDGQEKDKDLVDDSFRN